MKLPALFNRPREVAPVNAAPAEVEGFTYRVYNDDQLLQARRDIAPYVLTGTVVAAVLIGALVFWSAVAPLASGAVGPGVISVESNRKTIQHLEGGIVREIHVGGGDMVEPGDPLITLDATRANAEAEVFANRYYSALAHLSRLQAQRDGAESVTYPPDLLQRAAENQPVADAIAAQNAAFASQVETLAGRRGILEERIAQAQEQINGLNAQISSLQEQLRLIREEERDALQLMEQGLMRRPRLLALQREASALEGRIADARSQIAQVNQRIAESELQIIDLENSFREEVLGELRTKQDEVANLFEQLTAARDVLDRTVLRAPVRGTVIGVKVTTIGGVVQPGQPLMDIVPTDDDLIISAQVQPQHIDSLYVGMPTEVMMSGLDMQTTPNLNGEVISLSADRLIDERTGMPYFEAEVRIDADQLEGLDRVRLMPGMPADVIFISGERTAIGYFFGPLLKATRKAMVAE